MQQDGVFTGIQGARFPQNLQTKFFQHFTLFWCKFDFKVCISCQMKKLFLSLTTCRKYFLITGRKFLVLQVINCHRKKFIFTEEEISCFGKKFLVRGRNVLSQEEISWHQKKFLVTERNFLSREGILCYSQKFLVTGKNILSQEEISFTG